VKKKERQMPGEGEKDASTSAPSPRDQVTLRSRQLFSEQKLLEQDGERRREATRQTHHCCLNTIIIIINKPYKVKMIHNKWGKVSVPRCVTTFDVPYIYSW
jgi:hemin uptake protein HemP